MASILKVDTITGVATAGSIAVTGEGNSTTTNLQQGLAKAWNSFDGTVSSSYELDSFNSSTFTDIGTGSYKFAFTSSMNNINYASPAGYGGTETADHGVRWPRLNADNTTSETRGVANNGNGDVARINVTILGDLA